MIKKCSKTLDSKKHTRIVKQWWREVYQRGISLSLALYLYIYFFGVLWCKTSSISRKRQQSCPIFMKLGTIVQESLLLLSKGYTYFAYTCPKFKRAKEMTKKKLDQKVLLNCSFERASAQLPFFVPRWLLFSFGGGIRTRGS